jgi:carbon storage regulator
MAQRVCWAAANPSEVVTFVLSRKFGQSIVINGDVIVKVVRLEGDQIKLGIDAPREIIVREEIQRARDAGLAPGDQPSGESPSAFKRLFGLDE